MARFPDAQCANHRCDPQNQKHESLCPSQFYFDHHIAEASQSERVILYNAIRDADQGRWGMDDIDNLPDRVAHRRRIAAKINRDEREFEANDPQRTIARAGGAHRASGIASGAVHRGPHS
jgi:hypothetical protein